MILKDLDIKKTVERIWPLTEHYEYSAEVGMILRTTNPGWWAEFAKVNKKAKALSPQLAGFAFLEFLEGEIEKKEDFDLLLEEIEKALKTSATRLKVELLAAEKFLEKDIGRIKNFSEEEFSEEIGPEKGVLFFRSKKEVEGPRNDLVVFSEKITKNYPEIETSPLREKDLYKTHSKFYIDGIKEAEERFSGAFFAPDTQVTKGSLQRALNASGCLYQASEAVLKKHEETKRADLALCLVESWSHHAEQNRGSGTCLVNNIAVCANMVLGNYKNRANKVAVLDLDAHHGNGLQEIFYKNELVLTASIHQEAPFFPGSGSEHHRGEGPGLNLNINSEIGPKDIWISEVEKIIRKIELFHPDLILIELSGDALVEDPISEIEASDADFEQVGYKLSQMNVPAVAEIGAASNFYSLASAVSSFTRGWARGC